MSGRGFAVESRSREILSMAATGLPPDRVARACGCTEAHVREVMARYGDGQHESLTIMVPRAVVAALTAAAERAGQVPEIMAARVLAEAVRDA